MTVASLCRDYLAAADKGLVLGKRGRPKSETTLVSDRSRIASHIVPLLGGMAVSQVQPLDIRRFLHAVQTGKTAKTAKAKDRAYHPGHRRRRHGNPYRRPAGWHLRLRGSARAPERQSGHGVERPADGRRDRFLSMDEYRALGAALMAAEREGENPLAVRAVRLLALTGCRQGEVLSLTWPEVDLEARQLRLANSKEGYSVRPLGQAAADLLDSLPRHATSETSSRERTERNALYRPADERGSASPSAPS